MQNSSTYKRTPKQNELRDLIRKNETLLVEGGGQSGKTTEIVHTVYIRALHYPNTEHAVMRLRFNHAKASLWYKTFPEVAKKMGIFDALQFHKQDYYIECPNGSRIWIGGLDDKERTEKILGNAYATIYLNEASQISYDSYEIMRTRFNPPPGIPGRFIIDYNPPSKSHWGYKVFHNRRLPDGSQVPENDFGWIKMNPEDNKENISESYIKTLSTMSIRKRKRFLYGEYASDEGALWRREWIKYKDVDINKCYRVVVGVDPSGSALGDEIGIIVAGYDGKDYYVMDDYSMHGTPKEWGDEVIRAYETWKADSIIAEKNFGGDMVQSTITDMGRRQVKVILVNASRGKIIRAEPISAMYERGQVYHTKELMTLEDEMCNYQGTAAEDSPNRMDSLTWALTEISNSKLSLADVL